MFAFLLALLIAAAPAQQQDRLFEEAQGWRVFKSADGCIAFFDQPALSVTVFHSNNREVLTLIVQHANVPVFSDTQQIMFVRMGRAEWGPVEGKAYRGDKGVPAVTMGIKRAKALAEFGKASEIAITKRFTPPRRSRRAGRCAAADMLGRCVASPGRTHPRSP